MSKQLTTQKTLDWLRDGGWLVAITERWNPHARIRQDLFGFCDILAIRGDITWYVQCTSWACVPARKRKILESPLAPKVHNGVTRFIVVVGWKKGDRSNPRVEFYPFTTGQQEARHD
jgi:hypothetical protein